jgi:dipeptidase
MRFFSKLLAVFAFSAAILPLKLDACTNFIVTKGASADGSVMVTYNADAGGFMEPLYYLPAKDHAPNTMVDIYDWDSGKFLGKIKQIPHTYQVIGNMNEWQVAIGETTFTGREELRDTNGIIDYGSLIYLALQRSKTAREAIQVMTDLVAEYGYYSTGESFSVADANEAWIFELIGRGPNERGGNWVARKIPDGYICAHANQARIREFPTNDPANCLYSKDIVEFAKKRGIYDAKKDPVFKFADVYCPIDPGSLLACEGRVWTLFRKSAPSLKLSPDYWRAVKGAESYPLWIKPDKKLTVANAIDFMRDHFEGTEFDMTKGLAAGPFGCPYRWKPLNWKLEGDTTTQYTWERPISTQQSAFAFCSQARASMPREVGGVFWYGVDDNYMTVYIPLYTSIATAPECFTKYSIDKFSLESGFWVFNLVANLAYSKYSYAIKDIQSVQKELEGQFFANQPAVEKTAIELLNKDRKSAIDYLTTYSVSQSESTVKRWRALWEELVMKFNDGYINDVKVEHGRHPKSSGYGDYYFKKVVEEKPEAYKSQWREKK